MPTSVLSRALLAITSKSGWREKLGLDQSGLISLIGSASTTAQGIVELATDAETITGTDTARAVTPAGGAAAFQGLKTLLTNIGNLSMVADRYIYGTGTDTVALGTITSAARSLLADASVPRLSTVNAFTATQGINPFSASGASAGCQIGLVAGTSRILNSQAVTTVSVHHGFYNPNGLVGSITTNGSNTGFNTTSDRRLKDNIRDTDLSGSLARIMAIKVRDYTWKADGVPGRGVIADEIQKVVPEAVSGASDAVEEEWVGINGDGDQFELTITRGGESVSGLVEVEERLREWDEGEDQEGDFAPERSVYHRISERISPQGVDHSKLAPDLIGAVQAMMAEIAALKDEVSTLKSARLK